MCTKNKTKNGACILTTTQTTKSDKIGTGIPDLVSPAQIDSALCRHVLTFFKKNGEYAMIEGTVHSRIMEMMKSDKDVKSIEIDLEHINMNKFTKMWTVTRYIKYVIEEDGIWQ